MRYSTPLESTLGKLPGCPLASLYRDREVHPQIVKAEAELFGSAKQGEDLGVPEEGFRGNTTPVETDPSQPVALHDGNLLPQLGSPDGTDIATGTAPDYREIIPLSHDVPFH
jgi:hypothetical protein